MEHIFDRLSKAVRVDDESKEVDCAFVLQQSRELLSVSMSTQRYISKTWRNILLQRSSWSRLKNAICRLPLVPEVSSRLSCPQLVLHASLTLVSFALWQEVLAFVKISDVSISKNMQDAYIKSTTGTLRLLANAFLAILFQSSAA